MEEKRQQSVSNVLGDHIASLALENANLIVMLQESKGREEFLKQEIEKLKTSKK